MYIYVLVSVLLYVRPEHSYYVFTSLVQCCFTSTETIRLIRDGESRTATSTFTQLLSSVLKYILAGVAVLTATVMLQLFS